MKNDFAPFMSKFNILLYNFFPNVLTFKITFGIIF